MILSPFAIAADNNFSKEATAFYNDNNIDKAMETILKISDEKRTAQDWLLLGNILQDKEEQDKAVSMYKFAINTDATFYKAYYNLGNIYLNQVKCNMAIENYRKAIKYNPKFPYAYYNLGCAYIKSGDFKKAKKYLEKAVELKNTEADFQYNLAFVYKNLKKEKLAERHYNYYKKIITNN